MSIARLYRIGADGSRAVLWEVGEQPVVVGRSGQAQVNVQDEGLSRRHFLIMREGEDYLIKDLNSRNGTWVDGDRVFVAKLRHTHQIVAGRTRFLFAAPAAVSAAVGEALTGPHGTVIVSAAPGWERISAEAIARQEGRGSHKLEAAA